jgi:hypothetical protein
MIFVTHFNLCCTLQVHLEYSFNLPIYILMIFYRYLDLRLFLVLIMTIHGVKNLKNKYCNLIVYDMSAWIL